MTMEMNRRLILTIEIRVTHSVMDRSLGFELSGTISHRMKE